MSPRCVTVRESRPAGRCARIMLPCSFRRCRDTCVGRGRDSVVIFMSHGHVSLPFRVENVEIPGRHRGDPSRYRHLNRDRHRGLIIAEGCLRERKSGSLEAY